MTVGPVGTSRPRSPTSTADPGGEQDVVLLGATGTGKTATVAWVAERLQRPTLVMQPNKTLAAQFANELRQLPHNAVEYFVSYYDYYQPEAYVPQTDTYIEKDSSINEEVERLRHSATNSLLTRRDVIVVSTVSCIYGLGTPQEYVDRMLRLRVGEEHDRDSILRRLVEIQYTRNDMSFTRGTFRVRGDTLEIFPVYEELAVRIEFFGDEIERLMTLHPVTGEVITEDTELYVFPATHYVAGPERMERAIAASRPSWRSSSRPSRAGQAARGAAAADAHHLRHRDDAPGRLLLRHRELLDAHRRPHPRARRPTACSTTSPRTSCSSSTSPTSRCRRSAGCTRATCRASATWSTTASGCRARWTTGRCAGRSSSTGSARRSTSRRPRATTSSTRSAASTHGRADHPADRAGRPRGRGQADQGPDRRPDPRDQPPHREERAGPGHHADQEDVRGPHRLPPRRRHPHPLPPLRGRHAPADRAAA